MDLDISNKSLPIFAALDSQVRIKIIRLLSEKKMNVSQISKAICLSSPITIMHLNKLEEAHIIKTQKKATSESAASKLIPSILAFRSNSISLMKIGTSNCQSANSQILMSNLLVALPVKKASSVKSIIQVTSWTQNVMRPACSGLQRGTLNTRSPII